MKVKVMSVEINDFYVMDISTVGEFEDQKRYLQSLQRNQKAGLLDFKIITNEEFENLK